MADRPKVCIDRVLPRELMRLQRTTRGTQGRTRAVSPIGKTWMNGSTLRVRFIDGTAAQQKIARDQAGWWSQVANLQFDFNNAPNAEIRIKFDADDGAWSYVGTDSRSIPANEPTMNLGFLSMAAPRRMSSATRSVLRTSTRTRPAVFSGTNRW